MSRSLFKINGSKPTNKHEFQKQHHIKINENSRKEIHQPPHPQNPSPKRRKVTPNTLAPLTPQKPSQLNHRTIPRHEKPRHKPKKATPNPYKTQNPIKANATLLTANRSRWWCILRIYKFFFRFLNYWWRWRNFLQFWA